MTESRSVSSSSGGLGFAGALTIAFIVLKLTGVITWSWVWVLSPLWISVCFVLGILLVAAFIWILAAALSAFSRRG